jgi:small subunit ribosomal protein S5
LAKCKGSSNKHNVVKAILDALMKLRDPYTVAQQRGIKLEKVFNG